MKYYDLSKKEYVHIPTKKSKPLSFLYNHAFGRLILKLFLSKHYRTSRRYLCSNHSVRRIDKFVRKHNIDMSDYEDKEYSSFNDFFTRKIKEGKRKISDGLFAVADSKLSIYKIDDNSSFKVKNSVYTVDELLGEDGSNFKEGHALIFRLAVNDYHHYVFPDDGKVLSKKVIKGKLHTVQPIAFKKYKVFMENTREISYLDTKNYGKIAYVEIGAMLVGRIVNRDVNIFKRGEDKGYFEFGGSTVILLFEKDKVKINDILIENTLNNIENIVKLGESLE